MRTDHYLIQDGYTATQRQQFEKERILVCVACASEPKSVKEIGMIIGIFHALKVIRELHDDGYLIRYYRKKTGEIIYKTNFDEMRRSNR